ncbi:MAG: 2-hydroxyacyl-CoA dehydratase [Chloroflexi bacterium]|nr:2-hydroxyacyl-CoA dehydratase [Chloroflexota bacterium]
MKRIGITTTVPLEVLLAAGYQPVDLNNRFVASTDPERLIYGAERAGFPQNCCAWIKGLYTVCLEQGIDTVLGVTTGDCSNTQMLLEVLRLHGIRVLSFAFPNQPAPELARWQLEGLAKTLGTTLSKATEAGAELAAARRLAWEIDEMTWRKGVVSGQENHQWLVTTSDFDGSHEDYARRASDFIADCRTKRPYPSRMLRLAFIGVPAVFARDLYAFLERQGTRVVFNEVQRQFSMPFPGASLAEQYARYTYPYSVFDRIADIESQLQLRRIDGIIHYVQAFCHRGIADIIFRRSLQRPILTLEGNMEFSLNNHLRTRIEAFLEMLRRSQRILSQIEPS